MLIPLSQGTILRTIDISHPKIGIISISHHILEVSEVKHFTPIRQGSKKHEKENSDFFHGERKVCTDKMTFIFLIF